MTSLLDCTHHDGISAKTVASEHLHATGTCVLVPQAICCLPSFFVPQRDASPDVLDRDVLDTLCSFGLKTELPIDVPTGLPLSV